MAATVLVVELKSAKDAPLREVYPSDEDARAALRDLTKQVAEMKPVCVSLAGGIAFAYTEFVSARVMPHRSGGQGRVFRP
jgi:hypothetical protein